MREFNKSGQGPVQFTGFDMQTPNVANEIVRDFVAKADPEYSPTLARASELALAPSLNSGPAFGTASGMFPVGLALGKNIRFSGYIKTQDVSGYEGFWWRADAKNQPVSFANLGDAAPKGTTEWKQYELELPVPDNATAIYFGPLLSGSGTAWFDDLQVEIDDKPYTSDAYDFSFEGPALKGLNASVPTYPSRLDPSVAHSGKQSLRISHAATPVNPKAVDPKIASAEWTKVSDHLEASRERYETQAATSDIEWAIQNARVVLQCLQMRGNQVTRDASMAANVKWILDHSPGAKIVLWAHNGHVRTGNNVSMGSALRKMYGDQMVVFGFSFNEGSFQAVSQGGRGLKDFTVPPAPASSLDSTLAASGIPLFALDLRAAPKAGPVAEWLQTEHATRSIGALYPEDSPYAFMANHAAPEAFNVMLFVNRTTAARKNSGTPDRPGTASNTFEFKALDRPASDTTGLVEYRDPSFGVSLKMPAGWKVGEAFRWGDQETTAGLIGPENSDAGRLYFKMSPNATRTEEEVYKQLLTNPESKAAQRITAGIEDYRIRTDTVVRRTVGGRPAVSCVAEFTRGGVKMVEYLTWVRGENASAQFFAQAPDSELGALRQRLDPIIETLRLP